MKRIPLIVYKRSEITPDLVEAMRELEKAAARLGNVHIHYQGPSQRISWKTSQLGKTGFVASKSLFLAGREVNLRLEIKDKKATREEELAILWGLAIPLGFTPLNRYPEPNNLDEVFHFFGPWQKLYSHLCSVGRGELAWSSICAASQVDVGRWEGSKTLERFVQAQLHRLGFPCGPVDGLMGPQTLRAIQSAGLQGSPLIELADQLGSWEKKESDSTTTETGHILLPTDNFSISSYGDIATTQNTKGATLTVKGSGRIILDIRMPSGKNK